MKTRINYTLLIACIASMSFIVSCSKSDSNPEDPSSKFVGIYTMTSACLVVSPRDVPITASGTSAIKIPWSVGVEGTSCWKQGWIIADVSGNDIQAATASDVDLCNNTWTVTVTGNLNGNILTLIYSYASPGTTCTFTGPKK